LAEAQGCALIADALAQEARSWGERVGHACPTPYAPTVRVQRVYIPCL
jgi:hypothetical protein